MQKIILYIAGLIFYQLNTFYIMKNILLYLKKEGYPAIENMYFFSLFETIYTTVWYTRHFEDWHDYNSINQCMVY